MADHPFGPGYGPATLHELERRHAIEWEVIKRFIPAADGDEPILVASFAFTDSRGFMATGSFRDGREWGVQPLTYGRASLGVWRPDVPQEFGGGDFGFSDDVWDFSNPVIAVLAAVEWDGLDIEPRWWMRHPSSNRYRLYHADGSFDQATKGSR